MIPPERKRILVVDDEANLRRILSLQLGREGYEVHVAADGEVALSMLRENHIDLVLTDLRMPKVDGMDLLRAALRDDPSRPVIMMTAHGTVETAVEALKTGAFDYLTKPFDQDEVRIVVRKALRTHELSSAEASRADARSDLADARFGIIGQSTPVLDVYAIIERVADSPTTVLVTGESGTGKELVARALHEHSSRKDGPFIKVNCAAIPKDLMEAELFGYERGAFTGAVASKPGRFELASGGTLFLDEIGELPIDMQVKLLRVLQESEFERVGGIKTMKVDVRLVAATNRDLKKEIAHGAFREDLYYRLNVVPIALPALRERRSDIRQLVEHFVKKFNARLKKNIQGIEDGVLERLTQHSWPGNIRELENVVERAVLFADGTHLAVCDLSEELRRTIDATPSAPSVREEGDDAEGDVDQDGHPGPDGLKEKVKAAMNRLERDIIERALKQTQGNVTHAARFLKISRKGLQLKMKELGLRERDGE